MSAASLPEGTPILARPGAHAGETPGALAKLTARENRLFAIVLAESVVVAAALVALAMMLPLKSVVPVLVERDSSSGTVRASSVNTSSYQPSQNDLKYFLGRYVTWTYTIHRLSTEADLELARQQFTRGKAVTQFDSYVERERPIARLRVDPGYTRRVEIGSVSIFKDGAVVKFTAIDQASGEREARRSRMIATLQFSLNPPTDDERLILANPAGLYITDLEFTRDLEG
jgi:type IV secretory pathway component VirB8